MLPITQVVQLLSLSVGLVDASPELRRFLDRLIEKMPFLEAAGLDVFDYGREQFVLAQAMKAEGRDPTEEEWAALDAEEDTENEKMHRPSSV